MTKTIAILLLAVTSNLTAQNFSFNFNTTGRRVCLVEAEVNLTTQSVTIKLLDAASNTATSTDIYRRPLYGTGADWVSVTSNLPPGTTQWMDTDVQIGETWEYQIKRTGTWTYDGQVYDATGYTIGALLKDNTNYQGQMILLVADNIVNGLPAKYTRLKKELTGEGWFVNEIVVPRAAGWDSGDTVVSIRNQIRTIYNNASIDDKPKTLFILGHVPMPRSGSTSVTAPDEHDQNKGARGCDGYYADIDGVYTDTNTYNPGGLETPLAINLPGDFKWDQDFFPSALEMAFGRVDFADIIDFPLSELQLTERYLDRLSNYKNVAAGFDMGDKTGFFLGYDNSNDGSYRTLPNISKAANVIQNTVGAPYPQWVQANGPFKVYMQNQNFPEVGEWKTYGMDATVFSSDQSYWGFNDEPQSFYYSRIRALLAADTKCLVTLWTTSAVNTFHQACSGEPLGNAIKETMNYNVISNNIERPPQKWDTEDWWNRTHFAYNGDPTLRLYQTRPPSSLVINKINNQTVLSWNAAPDSAVIGYHIYKSTNEFGVFERITTAPLNTLNYTDSSYQQNDWYMIRAIKIAESGCGKFLNPSLGIFVKGDFQVSSVENIADKAVKIFPNPTKNTLTVQVADRQQITRLYDIQGRLIYINNVVSEQIDLANFPEGFYILQIGTAVMKVVKE